MIKELEVEYYEIRDVPKDWRHPKENNTHMPLSKGNYTDDINDYFKNKNGFYIGKDSDPPHFRHYWNEWIKDSTDCPYIQLYDKRKDVPITPPFENIELLTEYCTKRERTIINIIKEYLEVEDVGCDGRI